MVMRTQTLTPTAKAILGAVVMEALSGDISENTLVQLRSLSPADKAMPEPFLTLAKQAGGSAFTDDRLVRTVLIELRGACEELLEQV